MLLITTVAVQIRISDNTRRSGPCSAMSSPNWQMPSISSVIFGGRELLSSSSGEPAMASGYGPWKTSSHSASRLSTAQASSCAGLPMRPSRQA